MAGRPPKYTEDELASKIVQLQADEPLLPESSLCLKLDVAHDYIANYSKRSALILEARKRTKQIREDAWVKKGLSIMDHDDPNRKVNAVVYIWMTKNMLGWRDDPQEEISDESYPEPSSST